jgi:hypothetical protein
MGKKASANKKGIRNPDRPNGKAWKKGLPPEKRGFAPAGR